MMDTRNRDTFPFTPDITPRNHGNEAFRLEGMVTSYSGIQTLSNPMYSQNFPGGFPFPKYDGLQQHVLLPGGDSMVPQHPDYPYSSIPFSAASASHSLLSQLTPSLNHSTSGLTQSLGLNHSTSGLSHSSGTAHLNFSNTSIPNSVENNTHSVPNINFPFAGQSTFGQHSMNINSSQILNCQNICNREPDIVSSNLQNIDMHTKSRSISPHLQGMQKERNLLFESCQLPKENGEKNSEQQTNWSSQQQYISDNQENCGSAMLSQANIPGIVGMVSESSPLNFSYNRGSSSPYDLSRGSSHVTTSNLHSSVPDEIGNASIKDRTEIESQIKKRTKEAYHSVLAEKMENNYEQTMTGETSRNENCLQLTLSDKMYNNSSIENNEEQVSDNEVKTERSNPDIHPLHETENTRVNDRHFSVTEDHDKKKKKIVRFTLKGKLARKSYFERFQVHNNFVDCSLESGKDDPVFNFDALTSLTRNMDGSQGIFSLIQNLGDLVFPSSLYFQKHLLEGNEVNESFLKDMGSVSKRKMRQPIFHNPSVDVEKIHSNKKRKEIILNEEYLVKKDADSDDADALDCSSPDDKRGRLKPQPFAITSPSFSKAAARAVMTTSVANNATVVTISIANKSTGEMSKTRSVSRPGNGVMITREQSLPDSHKDQNEGEEGKTEDESSVEEVEVGKEKTSILSKLNNKDCKKHMSDNCKIEESEDRMEINVRIDDSQLIQHGDIKRWQCHMCSKSYTTKHNLVTHVLDHNGIKPHLCMVCGKYFKQLSHLNTHMLTHDNIKPHVCTTCKKGFTQISHLKRHQTVHQESRPYHCDICNRGFAYPSELRTHKERHSSDKENKCLDCGEEFDCQRALKQHQVTHGNCEELTCKYCSKVFRYPSQLKDHIVTHEGTRPYICGECGMDFMKEHHLRSHQFTHSGQKPWACPHCGRAFNQKANMQRHMLIHNSERSFKCNVCDKTFTQPQTLKAHMVVHADKKPYECQYCGKQFGRLHNLQGHMHMHNDSKPYTCFCGSSFTLKGNLNRHKKVKHGLNETTESMEEDAVNFLNELSERSYLNEEGDEEDEEETSEYSSSESKSPRKGRKSVPRKYDRFQTDSITDEAEAIKSQKHENLNHKIKVPSKYFNSLEENLDQREFRKRKRKPSRVSVSDEEYSNEISDSEFDEEGSMKREENTDVDTRVSKTQKTSKSVHLNSLIASKFKV